MPAKPEIRGSNPRGPANPTQSCLGPNVPCVSGVEGLAHSCYLTFRLLEGCSPLKNRTRPNQVVEQDRIAALEEDS